MLLTTAAFVLMFPPLALAGFFVLARIGRNAAASWLLLASLVFYAHWMPVFTLLLLVASIVVNYTVGLRILRARVDADSRRFCPRCWLSAGIALNLALLGYFKYAGFFVGNLNAVLGTHWGLGRVILPIGISF